MLKQNAHPVHPLFDEAWNRLLEIIEKSQTVTAADKHDSMMSMAAELAARIKRLEEEVHG